MKKSYFLAVALSALVLSGCASSGAKVTEQQLSQMKAGTTTWNDMVAMLGQPTSSTFSSQGTRMAIYSYAQVTTRPETFIPIIGAFVGGADMKSSAVVLSFDRDGKLTNYSGSASAIGTGTGAESGVGPERTDAQPRQQPPEAIAVSASPSPSSTPPIVRDSTAVASAQSAPSADKPSLGISFSLVNPVMVAMLGLDAPRGLVVGGINPDGNAMAAGIKILDVLLKVNGRELTSPEQLQQIVATSSHGDVLKFDVWRNRGKVSVAVTL